MKISRRSNRFARSSKSPLTGSLGAGVLFSSLAFSATLYWDGGTTDNANAGNGASEGGTGIWDLLTKLWDNGVSHIAWTNGEDAELAGSGGTVTVKTGITAGKVTLKDNNYTIATDQGKLTVTNGITTGGAYHEIAGVNGLEAAGSQTFDITGGLRISTVFSGSGTITKTGGGMVSLSNNSNTFSGKIVVNGGRFGIRNDASLGPAPASPVSDSITLNGGTLVSGIVNSAGGGFDNGDNGYTLHANRGIVLGAGGGTLQVGYGATTRVNIAGVISGAGSLTKTDSGTVALYGANTYAGGTFVNGGVLSVGEIAGASSNKGTNTSLGSGAVDVSASAQLVLSGNNLTIGNAITLNGNATQDTRQGALVGGRQDGASASKLTGTLTLAGTGDRTISTWWSDKSLELAGKVTGAGTLRVVNVRSDASNGGSVVILSNTTNDFSGGVIIDGGNVSGNNLQVLRLGAGNVIPDGAGKGGVTVNGRLELNGQTETINGLGGNGIVALGGTGLLRVGNNDATSDFSGYIVGAAGASLRKIGTGTLTLSGSSDNVDLRARVEAGTLVLAKTNSASAHAVGSGGNTDYALDVAGGTARLAGSGNDQIYANSAVRMTGGTLDLAGTSEGFDGLTGSGGTISNSTVSTLSTLTLGQNNSAGSPDFGGTLANGAGTLALTKAGNGTQTLSGANSYTGATLIQAGKLVINGNQAAATGAVSVSAGAVLGGSGTIGGATTVAGTHAPGNSAGVQTFSSALSYTSTGLFEWELASLTETGRGTAFDGVTAGGNLTIDPAATYKIILGTTFNSGDPFWQQTRNWSVFAVTGSTLGAFQNFVLYDTNSSTQPVNYSQAGSFAYLPQTGTLQWSAVPEVGNAAAGALLALGLLRRRRK